jgi:hypothetical protein
VQKDLPAIFMMENTKMIKNTDSVDSSGQVEINIKANIMKMTETDMEKCDGPMEAGIRVNGTVESNTDMER